MRKLELGLGILAGIMLCMHFCAGIGSCPTTMNQILIGKTRLHLHHWFLSMLAIIFVSTIPRLRDNAILLGIVVGCMLHGFMYKDWYVVIK
jgi:hypothetical protein